MLWLLLASTAAAVAGPAAAVGARALKRRGAPATWWADGYHAGVLERVRLASIGNGFALQVEAAKAFLAMKAAAAAEGVALEVNRAFADMAEQQALYADYLSGKRTSVVAEPGHSNHQRGLAVDLDTDNGTSAAYRWLQATAAEYGFRRTVASEPWHWEYGT